METPRRDINIMTRIIKSKKLNCGECKKFFDEDKLILDQKKNRYLCEGCYEPREMGLSEPDPDADKCPKCGEEHEPDTECPNQDDEYKEDEDNGEDIEYENSPRALRGEARITRERPPK